MTGKKYSMSFTTATLLYKEALLVAALFVEQRNWQVVREIVLTENRLQMRTINAARRTYREITSRLNQLTSAQLDLLINGSRQEQNNLLWLAVCKRYRFIYDFAVQVIREKYLRLDLDLSYDDYDLYFNDKAEWHPEVARVTEATRLKGRQVVFKMLREAELLTSQNSLIPALLTPLLIDAIQQDDSAHFAIFPVTNII